MPTPKVLVIAGSDSSGGAGLEADQRTLAAHGVYAMTVTTALTAQNTLGVQDIHNTPPAFVEKQIRCVLEDISSVEVVKLGMLASADTISSISRGLGLISQSSSGAGAGAGTATNPPFRLVLDPVMVSTSGAQLLPNDAVRNLRTMLLPSTYILTPNIPEAMLLVRDAAGADEWPWPSSLDDLKALARQVHSLGPTHVLLKGGHMPLDKQTKEKVSPSSSSDSTSAAEKVVVDILFYQDGDDDDKQDRYEIYEQPFLSSPNTHGTGCSLASALAANLATYLSSSSSSSSCLSTTVTTTTKKIPDSTLHFLTRNAINYVSEGIRTSSSLGLGQHGAGPINHLHPLSSSLPLFPRRNFIPYLLNHPDITPLWKAYTHHEFPTALAKGTLPLPIFKAYLIQDYHYLKNFARTYALAGYKSQSLDLTVRCATIIMHIRREMELHLEFCCGTTANKNNNTDTDQGGHGSGDTTRTATSTAATSTGFGLTQAEMEATPESPIAVAYSRYILDIGQSSDLLALFVAMAPCLIGYGQVAERIYREHHEHQHSSSSSTAPAPATATASPYKDTSQGNRYWPWIENYTADDYRQAVIAGTELIEDLVEQMGYQTSTGKIAELVQVFRTATLMEVRFWDFDAHLS